MMCDWKCTTSGLTASSTRALFCLMRHGRANRSQSCGIPAPAVEAVRGDLLTLVHLLPRAVLAVRGGGHDVHVVAALDEAGGEALGEARGAVDVGGEGVGADQDA